MGKDWSYFSKVLQSGSHEESIRMVATGIVDSSSVDSMVLDYDRSLNDKYAKNVKIIEVLGPAGNCPVVISTKVDSSIKAKLIEVLTEYFKVLEEESIRDNFVIIYELLDEMMDFGHPQTSDTQILKQYITQDYFKLIRKTSLRLVLEFP